MGNQFGQRPIEGLVHLLALCVRNITQGVDPDSKSASLPSLL